MYTEIVYEKELESIKKYLRDNVDVEKSLMLDGKNLRSQRKLQHIFFKKFSDSRTQKLFELVLTYAEKAERSCPGAGIHLLKNYASVTNSGNICRPTNLLELQQTIKDRKFSALVEDILLECLAYCKPTSRVIVKKSISQACYIEISNRYSFSVDSLLTNKIQSGHNAKVIVIDGYVENVSELHHIFQYFSTEYSSTPFLIFCRGMSDDVLNTISTNNQRETFSCHPFKVNFDLDSVNTLVDIAIVSGCDVVSSLKGELISSIRLDDLKTIDYFTRTNQGISLKNSKNLASVKVHIERLKKKSEDVTEDAKKYIYQRIKSLSSNSIEVAIPNDINYYSRSQELDEGIRLMIAFINKGPDIEPIVKELQKKLSETLLGLSYITN